PDPVLAGGAPVEGEIALDSLDIGLLPGGNLVEMEDAMLVELLQIDRADALDRQQIVWPADARCCKAVRDLLRCCSFRGRSFRSRSFRGRGFRGGFGHC